jgi:hypothetical protein
MGKLIEFYHPCPRPAPPAPVEEPDPERMTAAEVLGGLAGKEKTITDILIMMRDTDGQLGFVTNVADLAESCLFIDRVKHRVLTQDHLNNSRTPSPKGTA